MDENHLKTFREKLAARMEEDRKRWKQEWAEEERAHRRFVAAIVLGTARLVAGGIALGVALRG